MAYDKLIESYSGGKTRLPVIKNVMLFEANNEILVTTIGINSTFRFKFFG